MRLLRLRISRLPGIRPGFTLNDVHPGINVVVGPNASGKSSLLRALRAVLYREESTPGGLDIEATFEDATGELRALRVGADLQWSRAGQRIEAPPLPDHRFLDCYTLRIEDLLDEHDTDSEISSRIGRDLAGGYDLRAIRENPPFSLKSNHARSEAGALATAERELSSQIQSRRALQDDEGRLTELRLRKKSARDAMREVEACEQALSLLEAQRRQHSLEQQLADYPAGMEKLRGDESGALDTLQRQRSSLTEERTQATRRFDAQTQALAETRLDGVEIDATLIAEYRQLIQQLQQRESSLEQQRKALTLSIAHRDDAIDALGGVPGLLPELDPATIREVEQQLVVKRRFDAEIARLEAERVATAPDPSESADDSDKLREARRELLHWLSAPRNPERSLADIIAIGVSVIAAIAGIAAALAVHLALAILFLPLAWGLYFLLRRRTSDSQRNTARERFQQTGISPPTTWDEITVQNRLEALDGEWQQAVRRLDLAERHARAGRDLAAQQSLLEQTTQSMRDIAGRIGHDPLILDASFERWIRLVAEYDLARRAVATDEAECKRLEQDAEALRAPLLEFLERHDESPQSPSAETSVLSQRLEQLAERVRRRDEARRAQTDAGRDIHRLDKALADNAQETSALFLRADIDQDDETGLRQRVERLPAWQSLMQQLQEARTRESERRWKLGERADLLALIESDDETALRNRRDAMNEDAEQLEPLIREIARIENAIDSAGHDRALETARAQRQRAEDRLRERRDEELFAETGRFLIDEIAAEHVRQSQPLALRRATEWFRRFTRHQYELEFDRGGDGRFSALETGSNERRSLSELSSGTRMQLLLAVRIAFALEAERGREPLPLMLDEALTTADPERFGAVADSLRLLAEEDGRQVFYLTAQPGDVGFWASRDANAHVIDLPAVRGREHAITDPDSMVLPERPVIPEPGDHSAEEYAVLLGIPALDPWEQASEIPVFHLLRDRLALVRRLHDLGIKRIGPLRSLLASETAQSLLSDDEQRQLRARADAAEAWLEAWRIGRGRPVDRHALEDSGAVSDGFIEAVTARSDELGNEGEALIRSLEAGDVKRFQNSKREELAAWLTAQGYIDTRKPLAPVEIELRVNAAMQAHLPDSGNSITDAARLVAALNAASISCVSYLEKSSNTDR